MTHLLYGILLIFSWSANPPADAVTSYKLLFCTNPTTCPAVVDVGNVLTKQVDVNTATYSVVQLQAVNKFGASDPSSGVSVARPTQPASLTVAVPGS